MYKRQDYDYGWLEILDTVDLEIEDELEGPFTDLGEAIICKKSTGESIHVFIEDYEMCIRDRYCSVINQKII